MEFVEIKTENFEKLKELQEAYKLEIGEEVPSEIQLISLREAIEQERIHFYGCICDNSLVACCSVCFTYSTFNYEKAGLLK